ncbi:hypothetical protein quinque_009396 [Culex quinquefasciatus]
MHFELADETIHVATRIRCSPGWVGRNAKPYPTGQKLSNKFKQVEPRQARCKSSGVPKWDRRGSTRAVLATLCPSQCAGPELDAPLAEQGTTF